MTIQQIQIKLFARAKELAESESITVAVSEGMSVADLRLSIAEQYPSLKPLSSQLLIAIDNTYAGEDQLLNGKQEVACFPPVSGG